MENRVYLEYLIEFYDNRNKGNLDKESRPLPFNEIVGEEEFYPWSDLVDVIEKSK